VRARSTAEAAAYSSGASSRAREVTGLATREQRRAAGPGKSMREGARTLKVRRYVSALLGPFLRKARLNMLRVPWRRPRERARWLPIPTLRCYPRACRDAG
jgi:hypothetical protein